VPLSSFDRALVGDDAHLGVVRLRGEHDIATVSALAATLSQAISSEGVDVVVDLREVAFMDASTIGVIVGARNLLALQSRELTVRSPSVCARRVLDVCGLEFLDPSPSPVAAGATPVTGAAGALGTWVAVAAIEKVPRREGDVPGTICSVHDPVDNADATRVRRREAEIEAALDLGAP